MKKCIYNQNPKNCIRKNDTCFECSKPERFNSNPIIDFGVYLTGHDRMTIIQMILLT